MQGSIYQMNHEIDGFLADSMIKNKKCTYQDRSVSDFFYQNLFFLTVPQTLRSGKILFRNSRSESVAIFDIMIFEILHHPMMDV